MYYWLSIILKEHRKRFLIGVFWSFFTMLSAVGLVALSGWLITATTLTGIAITAGLVIRFDMYLPGAGIRYFALSRTIARYIERLYNHDTILRLIAVYRVKIFHQLSCKPLKELRNTSDSEWLSKLTADLDALDSLLTRYSIPIIATGLLIFSATVFLLLIDLQLALYLGVTMLLCCVIAIRQSIRLTQHAAKKCVEILNKLRDELIAHLKGAEVLHCQKLLEQHQTRIEQKQALYTHYQTKLNSKTANIQLALDVAMHVALLAAFGLGLYSVSVEIIDGPTAVMFALLFLGVSELVLTIPEQFSSWGKTEYASGRLIDVMNTQQSDGLVSDIVLDTVYVDLKNEPRIPASFERDIKFSLTDHQQLVITGQSGSGKSTLANLLFRIESCHNKTNIHFSGLNVKEVSASGLSKNTALMEQRSSILSGSLYYNLTLGLDDVDDNQVLEVLRSVELLDWVKSLPEGVNTWLGETGGQLSGGQARRICLARLILRAPALIVLDEPFNGLDKEMAERIFINILPWLKKRKCIFMLHEVPLFFNPSTFQTVDLNL